ncbi:pyridoxamine 5'-phosphate oxidase family protein [Tsukamurella sputi]|uniref:Pyridoxamine 5'-phosphate oxidase family protein n=1 Tax=Tsukamurella sputi TaxID=2591848 RepID=A0A5C5RJS7_9ACTN|nr:pyridoxamine 5'-phosphate oxidase family protein [Tsukamurella sputi]TWS23276.1 pyridoxamine 5'-phosphate oxidase family protein [Tsukamurella sputi]
MTASTTPEPVLHAGFSSPGSVATPWSEVDAVLRDAGMFWLSTVRADGRPHVCPLPAMWWGGVLYFVTGWEEQKARNLVREPRCVLTTGNNEYLHGLDVTVEGRAERCTDRAELEVLARMWETTLDWPYDVDDEGFRHHTAGHAPNPDAASLPVFGVRPAKILAFARGEHFAQTRFRP